jgi:hypothetical protein
VVADASQLAEEEAAQAEDSAIREAIARSLKDLVPADNALLIDAGLVWSKQTDRGTTERGRAAEAFAGPGGRAGVARATLHPPHPPHPCRIQYVLWETGSNPVRQVDPFRVQV